MSGARVNQARVIVEEMIKFDYEITLLTVRHRGGGEQDGGWPVLLALAGCAGSANPRKMYAIEVGRSAASLAKQAAIIVSQCAGMTTPRVRSTIMSQSMSPARRPSLTMFLIRL